VAGLKGELGRQGILYASLIPCTWEVFRLSSLYMVQMKFGDEPAFCVQLPGISGKNRLKFELMVAV
jgi:hypothetical protein